jgi:hypothetical protein
MRSQVKKAYDTPRYNVMIIHLKNMKGCSPVSHRDRRGPAA